MRNEFDVEAARVENEATLRRITAMLEHPTHVADAASGRVRLGDIRLSAQSSAAPSSTTAASSLASAPPVISLWEASVRRDAVQESGRRAARGGGRLGVASVLGGSSSGRRSVVEVEHLDIGQSM